MGSIHSELVGDELHIARTTVTAGNPNGVVTPTIIGEFYWDSTNNQLFVAESLLNTSWVTTTSAFDEFIELTDTPGSYSGQAGFSVVVNAGEDGLEFVPGAADSFLGLTDTPSSYSGQAGLAPRVNITEDALEFQEFVIADGNLPQNSIVRGIGGKVIAQTFLFTSLDGNDLFIPGRLEVETTTDPVLSSSVSDTELAAGRRVYVVGKYAYVVATNKLIIVDVTNPGITPVVLGVFTDGDINTTSSVFVSGNFAYITSSFTDSLTILDVSNPSSPALISHLFDSTNLDGASDVYVAGKYAYVTASVADSLTVVDISDPASMKVLGSLVDATNLEGAFGVVVSGQFAYVVSVDADSISIIDISDPTKPTLIGSLIDATNMNEPIDIVLNGGLAYVVARTSDSLAIINISDPTTPVLAGSLLDGTNLNNVSGISVAGNFAYVSSNSNNSIASIDISDPTTPVIAGVLVDGTNLLLAADLFVSGKFAYVLATLRLTVIDLHGIQASSANIGSIESTQLSVVEDAIVGGDLYSGGLNVGKRGIHSDGDISNKGSVDVVPSKGFTLSTLVDAVNLDGINSIFVVDNYAYVLATLNSALTIIDVSDPKSPFIVGTLVDITNFPNPSQLFVVGRYAYIISGSTDSLSIVDVSDVSAPVFVGRIADGVDLNNPQDINVVGKFAYVVTLASDSLVVIDISDPAAPSITGFTPSTLNNPRDLYVLGKYAYVSGSNRIIVVDISDPTNPFVAGQLIDSPNLGSPDDIYVVGRYAYLVATIADRFSIVDVSDPTNPTFVSNITDSVLLNAPRLVFINGNYAYAIKDSGGITIIDINDRTNPKIVDTFASGIGIAFYVYGKYGYSGLGTADTFGIIDLGGIDAAIGTIGNFSAGNISVSNDAVIKGALRAGAINAGINGIHSDGGISGSNLFATAQESDDVSIMALETTQANSARVETFVGDRDPNGFITGSEADTYLRSNEGRGGTFENKAVTIDTVWFKRSVNPSNIIEINTTAEFEALASGGLITVSSDLTLDIKINSFVTATRFVLTGGATLSIVGISGGSRAITYTTSVDPFISGTGSFRSFNIRYFAGTFPTTLLDLDGSFNLDNNLFAGWTNLGTFRNGNFIARFATFISITNGFFITNPAIVSVTEIAHLGAPFGVPLSGTSFFTINTDNPLSTMSFSKIAISTSTSIFDFSTKINPNLTIILTEAVIVGLQGTVFKQTAVSPISILSVLSLTPVPGSITAMADNGAGGTTISDTTNYFEFEEVVITGTTNYNGTFQIFNVVAGVSFDIITVFTFDDATGTTTVERIDFNLGGGHGVVPGDSIQVVETNFYNAFFTVLDTSASLITVNANFISSNTGTLFLGVGLNETDPRINAVSLFPEANSKFLASAFVNDNSTANGAIVNNAFTDMVFGIVGIALRAGSTMARWRLINELNGSFENINIQPFDGFINFDFTVESSGGSVDFRFKFQKSTDGGATFNDLDDPVEALVNVGSDAQSITKTFPLISNLGDIIKPQITRNSGNSGITTIYATINANG